MNIYSRKVRFKFFLFILAIFISVGSLLYTNYLVNKLANEERKKVELWAKATSLIINSTDDHSLLFLVEVIQNNETVPVIVLNDRQEIIMMRNLDSLKVLNPNYVAKRLEGMLEVSPPIEIDLGNGQKQYLYYDKSTILSNLTYYPFIQLSVIILFMLVAYFAFSSSRKAEQNSVWVGLSKETAHQLGTPISSLMAWLEILKSKLGNDKIIDEFEKDVLRLEKITDRFSKIGSKPTLHQENINEVVEDAVNYLRSRSSNKINFETRIPDTPTLLPINTSLFEWVLENIMKNAMDAIGGQGLIKVEVLDHGKYLFIDISDNGKGIPRSKQKTIFKPGYTTKERGWGLGLSLTKRIVEEYHGGKVFVAQSEHGKGTSFRIILNRA